MIIVGSKAAELRGVPLRSKPADVDLIGTREELDQFRAANAAHIGSETSEHDGRVHFHLKPRSEWEKIEFACRESPSDRLLKALCTADTAQVLNSSCYIPSVNVLYLTKRAQGAIPVHFLKTITDLQALKPLTTGFSPAEWRYYETWKDEYLEMYARHRQQFTLDSAREKIYAVDDYLQTYRALDLHRAVAAPSQGTLWRESAEDPYSVMLARESFDGLPDAARKRALQERFIVVGIEHFFLHDRTLGTVRTYRAGMVKALRDLFPDWLREFCLDYIDDLSEPPGHDFKQQFLDAETRGELGFALGAGADADLPTARRYLAANRLDEAEQWFARVNDRANGAGHARALFYLGRIYRTQGRYRKAAEFLRRAAAADPASHHALHELAGVCEALGKPRRAIACYLRTIRLEPRFDTAYFSLGRLFESRGQKRRAIWVYRSAQRLNIKRRALQERIARLTSTV